MVERGRITRVDGARVWVEIPRYGVGQQFGPCDVFVEPSVPLVVGAAVLVAPLAGQSGNFVVVGVLRTA